MLKLTSKTTFYNDQPRNSFKNNTSLLTKLLSIAYKFSYGTVVATKTKQNFKLEEISKNIRKTLKLKEKPSKLKEETQFFDIFKIL